MAGVEGIRLRTGKAGRSRGVTDAMGTPDPTPEVIANWCHNGVSNIT